MLSLQTRLLEHLTSNEAIFGGEAPTDPSLAGIDPILLHLEAAFSHGKRMEKIRGILPKTLELLGEELDRVIPSFVAACPPTSLRRIDNARQFHDFVMAWWQRHNPKPPYLPDIAKCELALAEQRSAAARAQTPRGDGPPALRRHPDAVLRRCDYDVRPVFEGDGLAVVPEKRTVALAFTGAAGPGRPRVFELLPAIHELLGALDGWTAWTDVAVGAELEAIFGELETCGLVEARR